MQKILELISNNYHFGPNLALGEFRTLLGHLGELQARCRFRRRVVVYDISPTIQGSRRVGEMSCTPRIYQLSLWPSINTMIKLIILEIFIGCCLENRISIYKTVFYSRAYSTVTAFFWHLQSLIQSERQWSGLVGIYFNTHLLATPRRSIALFLWLLTT